MSLPAAVRIAALDALCRSAGQRANPLQQLGFFNMARMMSTLSQTAADDHDFSEGAEEALLEWMSADNHWLLFPDCIGVSNSNDSNDDQFCAFF